MNRREFVALVPTAAVLAACGSDNPAGAPPPPPPPPPPAPGPTPAVTVDIDNLAFIDPDGRENSDASVSINVGEAVEWTNSDGVSHTVESSRVPAGAAHFLSRNLTPGANFVHEFDIAGTYVYFCGIHPNIMFDATVIVQ